MDGEGATYSRVCRGGCEDGLRRPQGEPVGIIDQPPGPSPDLIATHVKRIMGKKDARPETSMPILYLTLTTTVSISHRAPSNPLCFDYHISPSACLLLTMTLLSYATSQRLEAVPWRTTQRPMDARVRSRNL